MPRVCWLFEFPTKSGGENSLLASTDAIVDAGFEPVAVVPNGGPLAKSLRQRGIEYVDFQVRSAATNAKRPQAELRAELHELLTRIRVSFVHANSLSMGRLIGPVARDLGIPAIGHLRDIVKLSAKAMDDLNQLDRVLAVSEATREFHLAQGMEPSTCHVLHNGVDLEQFRPRPATGWLHRELKLTPKAQLVAAIGQLILRKGHDVFLQVASNVVEVCPDAHFLLIGERYSGKAEAIRHVQQLEAVMESPPLKTRTHLLGYRADVRQILSELHVLIHPARQEPLGRVLLEAAACGVPVIATDVGGTREIFPLASDSAILTARDDAATIARETIALLGNPDRQATLSVNARNRAVAAFDIRRAGPALTSHYEAVIR
ncbi:MAG: glycosyltransferase family 4 protein [Pirellulales bacterium]|nr:glycosyltransferase family 4 protein [Pirellulales bacterium]